MGTKYNPNDLSWLAGIIEGEGSLYIGLIADKTMYSPCYRPELLITNTDYTMVVAMAKITGNKIYERIPTQENRHDSYKIQMYGDKLRKLLPQIIPYIRSLSKKRQAEILVEALKLLERNGHVVRSKKITQKLESLRQEIIWLHDNPPKMADAGKMIRKEGQSVEQEEFVMPSLDEYQMEV